MAEKAKQAKVEATEATTVEAPIASETQESSKTPVVSEAQENPEKFYKALVPDEEKGHNTSVQYCVEVFCSTKCQKKMDMVFSTHITFVNLDESGDKKLLAV